MSYQLRCWYSACKHKGTCQRYQDRTKSSPSTGHHDRLCWTTFPAYVPVEKKS